MIDNRFNTAALAATSTERNTASSKMNDSTITAPMNSWKARRDAVGLIDVRGGDATDHDVEVGAGQCVGHDLVA